MRRNKNDRVPLTDGQFGDLKKKKKKKKAAFDLEEFEKELGESRDADNVDGIASGADGDTQLTLKRRHLSHRCPRMQRPGTILTVTTRIKNCFIAFSAHCVNKIRRSPVRKRNILWFHL